MDKKLIYKEIKEIIRNIPDFPKAGIIFRDVTPLLGNARLFSVSLDLMTEKFNTEKIDAIAGIDSRGFIFGAAVAARMGLPFIPIRKKNKLPWRTYEETYALEYGTDTLAIHQDAFQPGQKVLLVDDLLATGGTALASSKLIQRCQAELIGCSFLIELVELGGRNKLGNIPISTLIEY